MRAGMAAVVRVSASVCAVALLLAATGVSVVLADGGGGFEMSADGQTVIVRLRSFAPKASGRLEVEPTAGGGRVRLTASNLPSPQTLTPNARAFVAWASGGRIIRLGELRRDARGSGSLVFKHPTEFARYSLIVTAEQSARAERPTGAPVFSTRANEVAALFPIKDDPPRETALRDRRATTTKTVAPAAATTARRATGSTDNNIEPSRPATATMLRTRAPARRASAPDGFFTEVDEVLKPGAGGARTLTLVGDRGARRARGTARVATQDGTAYVRVRFRRLPPATRFGRGRHYAMWALIPEDGTVYMGSLPARNVNRRQTYARTEGVNSDKFRLLVTAERRAAPAASARPRGRRVLMTFKGRRRRK
jgi:hypothetical protein